ncbi:hypothetical protein MJO29_012282 [Puccinia striiformis f. sp. tritici]|nr:hypothetical protein MJO29_012282 [Puccinia striiformis f. sp. tritici]
MFLCNTGQATPVFELMSTTWQDLSSSVSTQRGHKQNHQPKQQHRSSEAREMASATAATRQRVRPIPWNSDGVNGGPSSMTILLDWLSRDGNYDRWCSGQRTKMQLCQEIIFEFNDHGIFSRGDKAVRSQIHMLEQSYFQAERFRRGMGRQLVTYDRVAGQGQYDDHLLVMCRHYWHLRSFMGGRLVPPS